MFWAVYTQVRAFREVLPEQTIGIFVPTALPGAGGIAASESISDLRKGASGKPIDLTGLIQAEKEEQAPVIVLGSEAISPEPQPSD